MKEKKMDFFNPIQEAFSSINQSQTQSVVAGFDVACGIFILIILLGTDKGFQQGFLQSFNACTKNGIRIYGGQFSETNLNKSIKGKTRLRKRQKVFPSYPGVLFGCFDKILGTK